VPQRAVNVEAGVSGAGRIRWSAVAYRMALEDEIDFDLRTFSYGNIGRSRHVGAEIEVEGRWQRVRPSASYALSRVVDVEADIQLKNVPRHALRVAMAVDLAWGVDAYMRYGRTSGAFLDDDGCFPVDGPSTVDLRIRRPGRYSLFLDLLNVTGNRYEEYGFTLSDFSGLTVPYAYSGAPRAVRGGFEVTF
jgi:outer membrane cobalamin receptor